MGGSLSTAIIPAPPPLLCSRRGSLSFSCWVLLELFAVVTLQGTHFLITGYSKSPTAREVTAIIAPSVMIGHTELALAAEVPLPPPPAAEGVHMEAEDEEAGEVPPDGHGIQAEEEVLPTRLL